ncbi:hypothetical protein ACFS6H_19860 [Terrimonas rubra]|uniref:Uncharacterized protein n=1 Tax=Terrimonas rubra TaxID=1035890 RepID=A0ABW6AB98_9BACT
MRKVKIHFAQDLIINKNRSIMAGFDMFIIGHPPISYADGFYDQNYRIEGYKYAQKMAEENGIAFTYPFKCNQKGCYPFQYGGSFVCNSCYRSGVDKDWWKIQVEKDGNEFCCHGLDFVNLQESTNYAFGKSFSEAISNY